MNTSAVFYGPPTRRVHLRSSVARVKRITRPAGIAVPALAITALLMAGCSSGGSDSPAGTASPAAASISASASEPAYTVTVVGKTVSGVPTRITVSPGEKVKLVVTADRTSELHVHAADPELETHTQEGQPVTVEFDAKKEPGLYEVEMHDPDLLLFQVQVK
jgi:plastocyanin